MKFKNQIEMFNYIWSTREHFSELSGKSLLPKEHSQWHWQFAHILPKGSYPKWKLNPENIILCLPDEHERQNEYAKFNYLFENMRRKYYKEFYYKEF